MHSVFQSLKELEVAINADKRGDEFLNRYPFRFVLFYDYKNFDTFIQTRYSKGGTNMHSLDKALLGDDQLLTRQSLFTWIKQKTLDSSGKDSVVFPISEIARFYDDQSFKALIGTIKGTENPRHDQQRVYLPFIGQQSRLLDNFADDSSIIIWDNCNQGKSSPYNLIIANNDIGLGIKGLSNEYSICSSLRDWVELWLPYKGVKHKIILSSKTAFDKKDSLKSDNVIDVKFCSDIKSLLSTLLNEDLNIMPSHKRDERFWKNLSSQIDLTNFNPDSFLRKTFNSNFSNLEADVFKNWLECPDEYSRWLLKLLYLITHKKDTYFSRAIRSCSSLSRDSLIAAIELNIFKDTANSVFIPDRRQLLKTAYETSGEDIILSAADTRHLQDKLIEIADNHGYQTALKYVTAYTSVERYLVINWFGKGSIRREDVEQAFPDLYHYTSENNLPVPPDQTWLNCYFSKYKLSKMAQTISEDLSQMLSMHPFKRWSNNFKTTKTLLHDRSDIDVFLWVDGLGIDWIPFIKQVIKEKSAFYGMHLNDVKIAISALPTRTENNKEKLEELAGDKLIKMGDLDANAHKNKVFPTHIDEEFKLVRSCVEEALKKYQGKKIAFISDHGLTYLAQYGKGLNFAGIKSDHAGRCAEIKDRLTQDRAYIITDDGLTACALTHDSISSKTALGIGAHGGATPEEILVPIIIVSNKKTASLFNVELLTKEFSPGRSNIQYRIKGITSSDHPTIEYNRKTVSLKKVDESTFGCEVDIQQTETKVTLHIGVFEQVNTLIVKTGVEENDLFDI